MKVKTAKRKKIRHRFYFRVARLVDPSTGEEIGALVPLTKWDQRSMKARKYHVGTELRAILTNPRNVMFHRLAHALGTIVAEQIEGFEGLNAHATLKKIQAEAGIFCDVEYMDASPVVAAVLTIVRKALGARAAALIEKIIPPLRKIAVNVPRSMSFDEMDEGEFQEYVAQIYAHIQRAYWPSMTEEQIALMVEIYERDH